MCFGLSYLKTNGWSVFLRHVPLTADKAKDNYKTQSEILTESGATTTQTKRKGDEQGNI
jgi:hypothetical protein